MKVVAIILAVIAVALYVSAGASIRQYADGYSADYGARDYIYSVENGRFGNLYDTAIHDMDKQAIYTDEVAEYRALAFYYEQAVLEHAYRQAGDAAKADECAQRMAEYEAQLGSASSRAQAVRDMLA